MTAATHARKRLVVVGGGVAGLAAARHALDLMPELEVRVLERAAEPGGLVETEHTPQGFLIEHGADCLVTSKPAGLAAVKQLGLADALRPPAAVSATTFLARKRSLLPLPPGVGFGAPSNLLEVLSSPTLSLAAKARMALEPWVPACRQDEDESVAAFIARRFGNGLLEQVVAPVLEGVYGASVSQLSARACLPRLRALEQGSGSVVRGMRRARATQSAAAQAPVLTLARGMGSLVHALLRSLSGHVHTGIDVIEVSRAAQRTFRLRLRDGGVLETDALILAAPAHACAALSERMSPSLAALLGEIHYGRLDCLSIAFRRSEVPHPLAGSGFVVPRGAGRRIRACTWSSSKWQGRAPDGFVLFRCVLDGTEGDDERALLEDARRDLAELLGIHAAPALARLRRRQHGLPIQELGCADREREIHAQAEALEGLALAGTAHGAMGIADCVESGRRAAERALSRPGAGAGVGCGAG